MASGYYAAPVSTETEIDDKNEDASTSVEPSLKKTKIEEIPVPSETMSLLPLNTGSAVSIAGPAISLTLHSDLAISLGLPSCPAISLALPYSPAISLTAIHYRYIVIQD